MYVGYKFITDPTFIHDLFNNSNTPTQQGNPLPPNLGEEVIDEVVEEAADIYKSISRRLNPYNWFQTSTINIHPIEAFNFQLSSNNYDARFYPFTEVHAPKP